MSEQFSHNPAVVVGQVNTDVVFLIKRMQQQLDFLEKKIDTLINQSQGKVFREKRFSKPYRSFEHSHRQGKGGYDQHRERDFSQGRPSARPGSSFSRDGEKREDNQSRGFGQKKKPFFHKHRNRE